MSANILETITAKSAVELEAKKKAKPLSELEKQVAALTNPPNGKFASAIGRKGTVNVIAELKKASPSKGLIRADFDPVSLAVELADAGAAALSVLTEKNYFLGSIDYLKDVSEKVTVPLLRKDFIYDPYQIFEARLNAASAILLIAAALSENEFKKLHSCASELGLDVLSEAHTEDEMRMLADCGAKIIGVNCRDLKTFKVSPRATAEIIARIPSGIIRVAESGMNSPEDMRFLRDAGADAFLIGEALMRHASPGKRLRELIGGVTNG